MDELRHKWIKRYHPLTHCQKEFVGLAKLIRGTKKRGKSLFWYVFEYLSVSIFNCIPLSHTMPKRSYRVQRTLFNPKKGGEEPNFDMYFNIYLDPYWIAYVCLTRCQKNLMRLAGLFFFAKKKAEKSPVLLFLSIIYLVPYLICDLFSQFYVLNEYFHDYAAHALCRYPWLVCPTCPPPAPPNIRLWRQHRYLKEKAKDVNVILRIRTHMVLSYIHPQSRVLKKISKSWKQFSLFCRALLQKRPTKNSHPISIHPQSKILNPFLKIINAIIIISSLSRIQKPKETYKVWKEPRISVKVTCNARKETLNIWLGNLRKYCLFLQKRPKLVKRPEYKKSRMTL